MKSGYPLSMANEEACHKKLCNLLKYSLPLPIWDLTNKKVKGISAKKFPRSPTKKQICL